MSWWLTMSASAGVSFRVLIGYWDSRIDAGLRNLGPGILAGALLLICASAGRSGKRPRREGIYLLPNLLTTGCLFSGFYAIVAAIDKNFAPAGIAVFVAMLFDTLDGRIARATHTESAFGKEY